MRTVAAGLFSLGLSRGASFLLLIFLKHAFCFFCSFLSTERSRDLNPDLQTASRLFCHPTSLTIIVAHWPFSFFQACHSGGWIEEVVVRNLPRLHDLHQPGKKIPASVLCPINNANWSLWKPYSAKLAVVSPVKISSNKTSNKFRMEEEWWRDSNLRPHVVAMHAQLMP